MKNKIYGICAIIFALTLVIGGLKYPTMAGEACAAGAFLFAAIGIGLLFERGDVF